MASILTAIPTYRKWLPICTELRKQDRKHLAKLKKYIFTVSSCLTRTDGYTIPKCAFLQRSIVSKVLDACNERVGSDLDFELATHKRWIFQYQLMKQYFVKFGNNKAYHHCRYLYQIGLNNYTDLTLQP